MKIFLIPIVVLLTGCSLFPSELSQFREEAAKCEGRVAFNAYYRADVRTIEIRCEWDASRTPIPFTNQTETP